MVDFNRKFDVLVIGGGNAAIAAAISARRLGASVLVLEGAPKFYRGGNTRPNRHMRFPHDAATDILNGPRSEGAGAGCFRPGAGRRAEILSRRQSAPHPQHALRP